MAQRAAIYVDAYDEPIECEYEEVIKFGMVYIRAWDIRGAGSIYEGEAFISPGHIRMVIHDERARRIIPGVTAPSRGNPG